MARTLISQGDLESALALLVRLYDSAQEAGKILSMIETLVVTSVVEMSMGRESAALATLQQALALAEPEGYVRTFLDEGAQVGQILRLLGRAYRQEALGPVGLERYAARLLEAWQSREEKEPAPAVVESARPPAFTD
jgi:LuxR family maltose regulon positive regulatory protein